MLEKWLEDHVGLEFFRSGFGRVSKALDLYKIWLEQTQTKIITVGGTNGKGQTCFNLESLALDAGLSTALWTSPHILSVTERFRFNGQEIAQDELLKTFLELEESFRRELSYYEFLLLAFCQQLKKKGEVDLVIFEVGLGGTLDGVNVFDAHAAAITSISFDHQDYLGETLESIFLQKWGITRAGQVVVTALKQLELRQKAWALANENKIKLIDAYSEAIHYQESNARVALHLYESVFGSHPRVEKQSESRVIEWLCHETSHGPGRYERMTLRGNRFIFIGAHNTDGLREMVRFFEKSRPKNEAFSRAYFSFSKRRELELVEGLRVLAEARSWAEEWRWGEFNHPKAQKREEFNDPLLRAEFNGLLENLVSEICDSMDDELTNIETQEQDILVTGSYYFISEVKSILTRLA